MKKLVIFVYHLVMVYFTFLMAFPYMPIARDHSGYSQYLDTKERMECYPYLL